jgi:integrin beta 8
VKGKDGLIGDIGFPGEKGENGKVGTSGDVGLPGSQGTSRMTALF